MSKALGMRCVWGLCGVLAGVLLTASVTQAASTDLSGSVVVWPKVVWTGNTANGTASMNRDTVIQLTNTSNQMVHAHCFYINAAPVDPNSRPSPQNPRLWQVTDFTLWLTRRQPTHWVVSQGRQVNPSDGFGVDGSGIDPGAVPPVPPGFEGELKCVQIDSMGAPFGGNSLKGEAVLRSRSGDVSKYNAISISASDRASGDPANILSLDDTPNNDGEYRSCPDTLLLNHFLDGSSNIAVEALDPARCVDICEASLCTVSGGACTADSDCPLNDSGASFCPIRTELTLVPCSQDFENIVPGIVNVQFTITNELEQQFSASTTVDCWLNVRLADITSSNGTCSGLTGGLCQTDADCLPLNGFCEKTSVFSLGNMGTGTALSEITPTDLQGGVIGVGEDLFYATLETAAGSVTSARAAWDIQHRGTRWDATADVEGGPIVDEISLPGAL
jgi:hypothetical protein